MVSSAAAGPRSRANALASSTAQGQERCRRRIDAAGVADDPGGDMPAAGSAGSWARPRPASPSSSSAWVQTVRSWAARTSSSQTALRRHRSKGRLARPVALAARMRSSTRARWRWRSSSRGQVRVGLVGEEDLEAVAVVVAEAQLGAGVGVLAAADRPGARRPGVQVDPAGQLAHLGAIAGLAVGVDRWGPGRARVGRGSPRGHGRRSASPARTRRRVVAQVPGQPGAGPGAVAADQDRLVPRGRWELGQGEVDQLDQILGGAGGRRCLAAAGRPAARREPGRGPGRPAAGGTRTMPL